MWASRPTFVEIYVGLSVYEKSTLGVLFFFESLKRKDCYVREIHSTAHRRVILSEGRSPKSKFCVSKIAVGGISGGVPLRMTARKYSKLVVAREVY